MSPFSMALMSGLKRQSVGARMASMPGCSSLRDMAKLVKLYICRKSSKAAVTALQWKEACGRSVRGSASRLPWRRAAAWTLSSTARCFPEPRKPSPGSRACRRRRRCPLGPRHPADREKEAKWMSVMTGNYRQIKVTEKKNQSIPPKGNINSVLVAERRTAFQLGLQQ